MEYGMRECPKCHKKHSRAVVITDPKDLDRKAWVIRCELCKYTGKGADTPEEALKNWNGDSGCSNYQYIKWHMNKKDMAKFLAKHGDCEVCAHMRKCKLGHTSYYECLEGINKWLDADFEEGTIL